MYIKHSPFGFEFRVHLYSNGRLPSADRFLSSIILNPNQVTTPNKTKRRAIRMAVANKGGLANTESFLTDAEYPA